MNKEELVNLKEQLLKLKKGYSKVMIDGTVHNDIYAEPLERFNSKEEIFDKYDPIIDEEIALDYFEKHIDEIINNEILQGLDFDGIKGSICVSFFANDFMTNDIDKLCHLPIDKFDKNNLLKDLVDISFNFDFISDTNNEAAERYLNNPNEIYEKNFTVNYERFTSYLISKGFIIDAKTFNEVLIKSLNGKRPHITINLVKNNKKVR